jgi:hypothetical protein
LRKVYDLVKYENHDQNDLVEKEVGYLRDTLLEYGSRIHSISLDKNLNIRDISQPLNSSFVNTYYQSILEYGFPSNLVFDYSKVPNVSSEIHVLEKQVEQLKALNGSQSKIRDESKSRDESKVDGNGYFNPLAVSRGTNTSLLARDINILEENLMLISLSAKESLDKKNGAVTSSNVNADQRFYISEYPDSFSNSDAKELKSSLTKSRHSIPNPLASPPAPPEIDLPMDVLDLIPNQESHPNVDAFIQGLTRSKSEFDEFEEHSTIPFHENFTSSFSESKGESFSTRHRSDVSAAENLEVDQFYYQDIDLELDLPVSQRINGSPQNPNVTALPREEAPMDSFLIHKSSQVVVPFMKTRMAKAIHLVTKHLVFDHTQNPVDYFQLYRNGLICGRLANITCTAISQAQVKPLHPSLKEIFVLDNHILSELLKDFDLPSVDPKDSLQYQLFHWISGLESLHRHFLPLSKSIFKIQEKLKVGLRLEEVLVLVRDYISLSKISQTISFRKDDVSKYSTVNNSVGDINISSSRIMGSMLQLNNTFSNWLQVLLDDF